MSGRAVREVYEMEFFEKMKGAVSSKSKEVADKAKDTAEILNLKGQISTCEEVIKKNYLEIGRLYYEQHGQEPDAAFEKQCTAVSNARTGIRELQAKIDHLKGL